MMATKMRSFFIWTSLLFSAAVNGLMIPGPEQISFLDSGDYFDESTSNGKNYSKIAIIGSGITGASAAFRLAETFRQRAAPPGKQPTITVFEKNPITGGRITQAYAYNDSRFPIDICAATFSINDLCVSQSAGNVGLQVLPVDLNDPQTRGSGVGVWNGDGFVGFVEEDMYRQPNLWSLFRQMKWYKRYGDNPWTSSREATNIRVNFAGLLVPPFSPIAVQPGQPNLTESVFNAGLEYYIQNYACSPENPAFYESLPPM